MLVLSPTVELGRLPPEDLLPPLPPISSNAGVPSSSGAKVTVVDTMSAAGSLMSLLLPQSELEASASSDTTKDIREDPAVGVC